jgi:hypothetical protein
MLVAEPGIDDDKGLCCDLTAEGDEFIEAEVVVLYTGPGGFFSRGALIAVTDAISPVVAADKISSGPAIDWGIKLFEQFERISPHTFDVICRHKRDGAYAQNWLAVLKNAHGPADDFQATIVGICTGGEGQGEFPVLAGQSHSNGLAILDTGAPTQTNVRFSTAGKYNPSFVFFAFAQCQYVLHDTATAYLEPLYFRGVLADIGIVAG